MKRSFRMNKLAELAEVEERAAGAALAQANIALMREQASLDTLKQYLTEYEDRARATRTQTSAQRMKDYANFVQQLNVAIREQSLRVAQFAQALEVSQQEWLCKHQRVESLEKVANRAKCEEDAAARKSVDQRLLERVPYASHQNPGSNDRLN